ncbi:MAG: type II toxin-antitoxin system HicB family antitoxin [Phycisphaerae bacterium]|nr:type II toxin-antitoxin system HicB family antitoxin [Phycisphaerae bacterium]
MKYKGYVGKVEYDAEANILHGEVVGIRDVVTFQAKSVEQVQQAFKDSVDDYLEFCKERGQKPDKPCSGRFVVRIGSELHRRANMLAALSGKSLNTLVSECLDKEVTNHTGRFDHPKPKPGRKSSRAPQRRARKRARARESIGRG